ncbi:MAG: MinD/ParA family protein [Myxococcales bacterium]|nr:MinD/ParA family protein [Myxococcota bacterium]MDW8283353.1 MinD/ParA family protein [Myxococcales bacterium]
MRHQAQTLRRLAAVRQARSAEGQGCRVVAVTSGKGGVGKTNVAGNLAVALTQRGLRVLVVDGDLGMADLNLVYGIAPRLTLLDVLAGRCTISEVLARGPAGVYVLPACAASFRMANLSDTELQQMWAAIAQLEGAFDIMVIDTGAGIGATSMTFAAAADQPVLVVTPEPSSIADGYAVAKVLSSRLGVKRLWVLPNQVSSAREAHHTFRRLATLVGRFLDLSLVQLGHVPMDQAVAAAVRAGRPFQLDAPDGPAARGLRGVAQRLCSDSSTQARSGMVLFFHRCIEMHGGAV